MQRTPEPELMDEPEQARAYAAADFSEPHEAFVDHFVARFPGFAAGRVADLGCGPADVTLRFARRLPQVSVLGIDGAEAMLALGREAVRRAGLGHRVELRLSRLQAALPGGFDAVISNSLLHHLHEPMVLWRAVRALAAAGAPVMVMDLMRPSSPQEAQALVATYAADAPPVLKRDFLASLHAAFRVEEVKAQLAEAGLGHFAVEAASDRHLLAWGRA